MSTSVTAAGAMGTPQRPFPPGQGPALGKGQGVRHPPQLRDRPHNHCTDTTPTSKLSSAEELWQDFAPARQCKMKISSFTASPPACHPWVHNGKMLYKLLDHIFTYFATRNSYRNNIDMSTLPSKLILQHILKSLLLSQAFCRWATAKPDKLYLHLTLGYNRTECNTHYEIWNHLWKIRH